MKGIRMLVLYFALFILAILVTAFSTYAPFTFKFQTITYTKIAPESEFTKPTEPEDKDLGDIVLKPVGGLCVYSSVGLPFSFWEKQTSVNCSFSDSRAITMKSWLINTVPWFLIDVIFWFLIINKIRKILNRVKKITYKEVVNKISK